MYAFALLREIRSSEICLEINRKPKNNIPGILDRNLKQDQQIVIILGKNIFDN